MAYGASSRDTYSGAQTGQNIVGLSHRLMNQHRSNLHQNAGHVFEFRLIQSI